MIYVDRLFVNSCKIAAQMTNFVSCTCDVAFVHILRFESLIQIVTDFNILEHTS